jgi:hypothetical protein
LGQISLSTKTARSGRQWAMNRSAAAGVSMGMNWWTARGGKRWASSSAEASVPDVANRASAGSAANNASTKGKTDRVSPTLAPCSQTSLPEGRSRLGRPSRSGSRWASSLPCRARRRRSQGARGAAIRVRPP